MVCLESQTNRISPDDKIDTYTSLELAMERLTYMSHRDKMQIRTIPNLALARAENPHKHGVRGNKREIRI